MIAICISNLKVPQVYSAPISNNSSCLAAISGKGAWWINPNNYNTTIFNETTIDEDEIPIDRFNILNPLLRQVNSSLKIAKESVSKYNI